MEYWLRLINTVARNRPPILLVGTHRDQRHEGPVATLMSTVEAKYRKAWCGNIRGVHCVSCVKRIGVDELKRSILDNATKVLSSVQVPAYYLSLKQLLYELKAELKDYVQFSVFEARARDRVGHIVTGDDPRLFARDLKTALLFFADCGLVLYFDSPQLSDFIILDPKWLATVLATYVSPTKILSALLQPFIVE
jgi:hypothetical protein